MKRIFICLVTCLIVTAAWAGCGTNYSFGNMETVEYSHPVAGFSLVLPNTWKKNIEDERSAGFFGQNPGVSLEIVSEIGGYDYFSCKALAEEIISALGEGFNDLEIVEGNNIPWKGADAYEFAARGELGEDQKVTIKGFIFSPDIGIRYYLLFTCASRDYPKVEKLFRDAAASFKMTKTVEELHQQLSSKEEEQ